jgi:hypothetical protein
MIGPTFLNYFYLSSSVALVQEEVRPNQRVMSGALLLLVMNFIGMGVGPTYVGAASDFFRAAHPENSLQIALYTLIPVYLVAIACSCGWPRCWAAKPPRPERSNETDDPTAGRGLLAAALLACASAPPPRPLRP